MLWLLLLHISAVVCWCSSLLYLPALIADTSAQKKTTEQRHNQVVTLKIFRLLATPAALIAIATGTTIFIIGSIADHWLILKLTLIVALVLCHAICGWTILNLQKISQKILKRTCTLLSVVSALLIPSIIWVVLTKPF